MDLKKCMYARKPKRDAAWFKRVELIREELRRVYWVDKTQVT